MATAPTKIIEFKRQLSPITPPAVFFNIPNKINLAETTEEEHVVSRTSSIGGNDCRINDCKRYCRERTNGNE